MLKFMFAVHTTLNASMLFVLLTLYENKSCKAG